MRALTMGQKISETDAKQNIMNEQMDERQKKIEDLKLRVEKIEWPDIMRFFSFLRQNTFEEQEHKMFLTEQSIRFNLAKYFGHQCNFLERRLYVVFSGGKRF